MQDTRIQWCTASWNPTRGCRRIGEGCRACYAEKTAARFNGPGLAYEGLTTNGRWNGTGRWLPEKFLEPLSWRKPERIFVNSMSDLFFEEFDAETVIAPIFATMSRAHWHTFIVLTKRYERAAMLLSDPAFVRAVDDARGGAAGDFTWPLPNVIVGGSLSNQDEADRWAVCVASIPAAVTALSLEPLIGPVDLTRIAVRATGYDHPDLSSTSIDVLRGSGTYPSSLTGIPIDVEVRPIGWVIVGGESGSGARPCNVEWIRPIVQQCEAAGTPVFVKQLGAQPIIDVRDDRSISGWRKRALRDRKGGDFDEFPADLRIRQFPEVPHA